MSGTTRGCAPTLNIHIAMPANPYTTDWGRLDLVIDNGLVTRSRATGHFAGYGIPGVGEDVSMGLDLPDFSNDLMFDYDFTSLQGAQIEWSLEGGGDMIVPSNATLALLALGGLIAFRRHR